MEKKKEIGKLLELLNECKPTVNCANFKEHYEFIDDDIYLIREGMDGEEEHFPMYVCYKKGEFVKWLVENDKIDRDKKEIEKSDYDITFTGALTKDKKSDLDIMVDTLLMLLSISDTPIEDLISHLK